MNEAMTVGMWVAGASGALGLLTTVTTTFALRREVEGLERRCEKLEAQNIELRREMTEMERRLDDANEERAVQTHNRINDVLKAVSTLAGQFSQASQAPHKS